jgi:hypothetical protein
MEITRQRQDLTLPMIWGDLYEEFMKVKRLIADRLKNPTAIPLHFVTQRSFPCTQMIKSTKDYFNRGTISLERRLVY